MIEIEAGLDSDNILRVCRASGHAGAGKPGTDIVCAAVSVLIGTAFTTLSGQEGITIRGEAPKPGQLWLEVDYDAKGKDFLLAIGKFLINGLLSVEQEFPNNCKITFKSFGF